MYQAQEMLWEFTGVRSIRIATENLEQSCIAFLLLIMSSKSLPNVVAIRHVVLTYFDYMLCVCIDNFYEKITLITK